MAFVMILALAACGSSNAPPSAQSASSAPSPGTSAGIQTAGKYEEDPNNFYYGKTVTWIVPWTAGGSTDITSRALAAELEDYLGCTVVVMNTSGGGGLVGFNTIIGASADGLTIGSTTSSMLLFVASGKSTVTYDQADWIAMFQSVPAAIMVPGKSDIDTLDELVEYGKAHPGELNYSTSGFGSYTHAAISTLAKITGAKFALVPYDSGTNAATAAAGGHVGFAACAVSEAAAMVDSGELKMLAVIGDDRSIKYPDIETTSELGYEGMQSTFTAAVMPEGCPEEATAAMADALKAIITSDYWVNFIETQGAIGKYMGGEEFDKFLTDLNTTFESIEF